MYVDGSGGWTDIGCGVELTAFVCKRPYTVKISSNGNYVGFVTNGDEFDFWDAEIDFCDAIYGTTLASIHSDAENEEVVELMNDINAVEAMIGFFGYYYTSSGNWYDWWTDYSDADNYVNWDGDFAKYNGYYAFTSTLYTGGKWQEHYAEPSFDVYKINAFICNYDASLTPSSRYSSDGSTVHADTDSENETGEGEAKTNDGGDDTASSSSSSNNDGRNSTLYVARGIGGVVLLAFLWIGYLVYRSRCAVSKQSNDNSSSDSSRLLATQMTNQKTEQLRYQPPQVK